MRTIWKFPIPMAVNRDEANIGLFTLSMPQGSTPLSVHIQAEQPVLYALVEPGNPSRPHHFTLVGTGQPLPEPLVRALAEQPREATRFVGTYQLGWFVGHVFALP